LIVEAFEAVALEASSPPAHRTVADLKPPADLGVGLALRRQQNQLCPQDLPVGAGVAGGAVGELFALSLGEGDLGGWATGHLRSFSPQLP
jgi:hypothetical protein